MSHQLVIVSTPQDWKRAAASASMIDDQISRAVSSNRISRLSFTDAPRYIPATAEF